MIREAYILMSESTTHTLSQKSDCSSGKTFHAGDAAANSYARPAEVFYMVFLQSLADQVTTSHPAQTLHISIDIRSTGICACMHACARTHTCQHINRSVIGHGAKKSGWSYAACTQLLTTNAYSDTVFCISAAAHKIAIQHCNKTFATARAAAEASHAATATQNKQQQETDQRALVGVAPPPQPAARLGVQQQQVGLPVLPVLQLMGYLDSPALPLHLTRHPGYTAQTPQLIVQAVITMKYNVVLDRLVLAVLETFLVPLKQHRFDSRFRGTNSAPANSTTS